MNAHQQVRFHYLEANRIAIKEVEQLARIILVTHPELDHFVLAMGHWFFSYKDRNRPYLDDYADYKYLEPLKNFIAQWDGVLKLTGEGIKFTATGPIITDF